MSLPTERVNPQPPFSWTAVDYFGPFFVTVRRSMQKRYGVLLNCLVTRAVQLELVHSLYTDSFLLAFCRFADRRGAPSIVFSDNGTNFVAAERELREAVESWNQSKIIDKLARQGIEWKFSRPSAPHFGGVWERIVRSCKVALRVSLNDRVVTDEVLHTVFTHVEALLNGKPLTHLSVDPTDLEPLTPNHFLIGRVNPNLPQDLMSKEETCFRRRWRHAQFIVNQVWKRRSKSMFPA